MKVGDLVVGRDELIDGKGLGIILEARPAYKFGYDYKVYWTDDRHIGWVKGWALEAIKDRGVLDQSNTKDKGGDK